VAQPTLRLNPVLTLWETRQTQLLGGAVVLALSWVIYLLFSQPLFYVFGAQINGHHLLSGREIYAASEIHNQSVFWVDPDTVKQNVEALPNVKSADVRVLLPAKAIISVDERQPEVIWQSGNSTWWIDGEGTFVPPQADESEVPAQLRIVDGDKRPIQANDKIDPGIIRGAQLVKVYQPEVTELLYTQAVGLIMVTEEGWPIYLGTGANMRTKLRVAETVRQSLITAGIAPTHIDVREPLRVVYETRPEAGSELELEN
jgi:hypothetical protein